MEAVSVNLISFLLYYFPTSFLFSLMEDAPGTPFLSFKQTENQRTDLPLVSPVFWSVLCETAVVLLIHSHLSPGIRLHCGKETLPLFPQLPSSTKVGDFSLPVLIVL